MSDLPWSKFFWADWESDQSLRLCSLGAQGLWMRMLCVCARSEPYGYLAINDRDLDVSDIARLAGVTPTEVSDLVDELERNGVFSRDRKGRIYSRRLLRDKKRSDEGRKHVKKRWDQTTDKEGENPPPNRVPNRQPKTQKPEARDQKKEAAAVRAPEREPDEPLLRRVLRAVRLNEADILPAYWMPPGAEMHIQRQWVTALGLTPDEIVAVAEAERSRHEEAPRGPVALDGAMRRLSGQKQAAPLAAIQTPDGRATAPPRGLSDEQFDAAFNAAFASRK